MHVCARLAEAEAEWLRRMRTTPLDGGYKIKYTVATETPYINAMHEARDAVRVRL